VKSPQKNPIGQAARAARAEKIQRNATPKVREICRIFGVSAGLSQKLRKSKFFSQPRNFRSNVKRNRALAAWAINHGYQARQLHSYLESHDQQTTRRMARLETALSVVSEELPHVWCVMTKGEKMQVREAICKQCEITDLLHIARGFSENES